MVKKDKKQKLTTIAVNKKARYNYFIEQTLEAGLNLRGWEVKSLRCGRAQIKEGYVIFRSNEMFLSNAHIAPLKSTSTHVDANPVRMRKLLLHRIEINKIRDKINQKGITAVPLRLYWLKNKVKLEIGLAKGKKEYDKRQSMKLRDWERDKYREFKEK